MKYILLFCFFVGQSFACALCATYTPTTLVKFYPQSKDGQITSLHITWEFSKEFSSVLLENYDFNYNDRLDEDEILIIKETFLDYLYLHHHLSELKWDDEDKTQGLKFEDEDFVFRENRFFYSYEIPLNLALKEGRVLSLKIHDERAFFNFQFDTKKQYPLDENFYLNTKTNLEWVFFQILKGEISQNNEEKVGFTPLEEKNFFQKLNDDLFALIKNIVKEEASFMNLFLLIALSLAYGIFHASGPGHAKTLIGSYFLTHQSSSQKILFFCLKIALVHILSAFLLVSVFVLTLKIFLPAKQAGFIITQLSSLVIIFLALFLLTKKILKSSHPKSCPCCTQKKTLSELSLIGAVAIIPCPGTILLFVLAYEFSFLYAWVGAVFMSLGMSLTLFVCGLLANRVHIKSKPKLRVFLEYLGFIFMLLFGIFLFINTQERPF